MAHKGRVKNAAYDENTLESFVHVARVGADYAETDVRITQDGRFVLMHDPTVDRTTDGTGRVEDLPLETIRGFQTRHGYRVPTLSSVLRTVQPTRMNVRLETKDGPWTPKLWDKYFSLLRRTDMAERTLLNDQSRARLTTMNELAPDIESSWKTSGQAVERNWPAGMDGLVTRRRLMATAEDVQWYQSKGLQVHAPLANRVQGWQHWLDLGVDSILTDNLRRYQRWCAST